MKKTLRNACCILICMAFIFSGCTALYEDNDISDIPEIHISYVQSGDVPRDISETIYYYNKDTGLLEGELTDFTIYPRQNEERLLINKLLSGPDSNAFYTAMDAELSKVELLDDVANVYLKNAVGGDRTKYLLASQIADTLIGALGVEFVCVFFDGKALNIDGYAVGALGRSDGDPASDIIRINQNHTSAANGRMEIEVYVPLYFIDGTMQYFIPETRKIVVEGEFASADAFNKALIKSIIAELADGPNSKYYLSAYVAGSYLNDSSYSVRYSDNELELDERSDIFTAKCAAERSAFYYTVAGVIPLDEDVRISGHAYDDMISRESASAHAGASLNIYIPDADADGLERVTRIVAEEDSRELTTYVRELLEAIEERGYYRDIAQFKEEHVSGIRYDGSIVLVDLTSEFFDEAGKLDVETQKLMVFAIVNTLDTSGEVTETAIRKNGDVPLGFAGNMDMEFPLMPNYGLTK